MPKSIHTSGAFPSGVRAEDVAWAIVVKHGGEVRIPLEEVNRAWNIHLDFDAESREIIVRVGS